MLLHRQLFGNQRSQDLLKPVSAEFGTKYGKNSSEYQLVDEIGSLIDRELALLKDSAVE
jgi:hypothetical protein